MRWKSIVLLLVCAAVLLGATHLVRVRKAILPGEWYPAEAQQLYDTARNYAKNAPSITPPGKMVAAVVPHTVWAAAGPMAGEAFHFVREGAYDRVIVLTASHYARFRGCSIPAVQFYETPLGSIALDLEAIKQITWNPFIETRSVSYNPSHYAGGTRQPVHEREHGVETVLPFMQATNGAFLLVPIVVSELKGYQGKPSFDAIDSVAEAIRPFINERTLVIVTTHFTPYGAEHQFRPFNTDVQEKIQALDLEAIDAVLNHDTRRFLDFLDASGVPIDGAMPLAILTRLFPKRVKGELLNHTTTGLITGSNEESISFATMAFFDPNIDPGEAPPERTNAESIVEPVVEEVEVEEAPE